MVLVEENVDWGPSRGGKKRRSKEVGGKLNVSTSHEGKEQPKGEGVSI